MSTEETTMTQPAAEPLPMTRVPGRPFDPPAELAKLRQNQPLSRMAYPDGHVGWLATSHELVRAVLADSRFSARADLAHPPLPGTGDSAGRPAPPGIFTQTDPPEHTRYRRLLTGQFTVRRMRLLTERVEEITAACLDEMERAGDTADLRRAFALPIPGQVICELLGVPESGRERFQDEAQVLMQADSSPEERFAVYTAMQDYLRELVLAKRAEPTDDLLGGLAGSDLTDEELTNIAFTLLGAGFDTTANMITLGAFALLENPALIPELAGNADAMVEELLRYLSIVPCTVRVALEDVELAGQLVKAGEAVTVSVPAANHDPARFPDPEVLDPHRATAGHVAFGHGIHQCLGQQLARVEMRVALPALFARFPELRLAVPAGDVPLGTTMLIYGVHELPVTWAAG
ncbi:cytochrome P450 [Amycolatopsis sp. NPDC058986]|uniref:cytochrome P450 n=1 Tax=unclassified Amycolatopsis TaxID=2618356 RepID=UPI003672D227